MPSCREIDALVTPFVDGEVTAAERALVQAHLEACPPCRRRASAEAVARETVRRQLCRPAAPDELRTRCLAAARAGAGPFGIPRSTLRSFSLAAGVVLVAGGIFLYGLTKVSPSALAAQLAIDHVTCFAVHAADAPVDIEASEQAYLKSYGHQLDLPHPAIPGVQFVGLRRCYCGEGPAAHAMYRLDDRPVSLYIIPNASRDPASADVFGHEARIWSDAGTTYVLVSPERETLARFAEGLGMTEPK